MQFMKVHCTENAKNAIESLLKKERLSARQKKDRERKYHDYPEKKIKKGS